MADKFLDEIGLTKVWEKITSLFARKEKVYTKEEVDTKIGDIDAILDTLNGEVV